jgi:hypothetical protein
VSEQRYQAILAVIGEGRTVTEVAAQWGVSRQARLMPRERTQLVCDGLAAALHPTASPSRCSRTTGRFSPGGSPIPPAEMLFDRICRENGVEHLLTQPRKPTTTGKIERFHRTMRIEFDTTRVFTTLKTAQGALDEWVSYYNTLRTHQSLSDATPASRFQSVDAPSRVPAPLPDRSGERSPARSHATGSSALAGSRSASARTTAAAPATSSSLTPSCSSGSATSYSRPWPVRARAISVRSAPPVQPDGANLNMGVSRIYRMRLVKHQPKADRPTPLGAATRRGQERPR